VLTIQTAWRKANLACKIAIDNAEKDELLIPTPFFSFRKTTKESLAEGASNITENLMGISRMMSQQVRVQFWSLTMERNIISKHTGKQGLVAIILLSLLKILVNIPQELRGEEVKAD
uniref:Uncharacterized protein n=1 Tax=Podarcis muralis TaxID=64176 RepID=A0A670IXK4_PODMU